MARIVEITQPSDFVSCDDKGRATVAFSISNIRDAAIQVGAKVLVDAPAKEEWVKIAGGPEWDLAANATDQITVNIQAPDDAKPEQYRFRLLVYSIDEPGEDFTKGEPVSFEVKEKPEPQPAQEKPFPIWIVIVGVLCVLVIGGVTAYLLWKKPPETEMVALPNVEKISFANAYQRLTSAGLAVGKVDSVLNTTVNEDFVVKQDPHPSTTKQVSKGSKVNLTVAKRIKIPDIILRKELLQGIRKITPQKDSKNAVTVNPTVVKPTVVIPKPMIFNRGVEDENGGQTPNRQSTGTGKE